MAIGIMMRVKIISFSLLAVLVLSVLTAISPVAATSDSSSGIPQVTQIGNSTMITTDNYTVIFRNNGTMPSFVWWANDNPSEVYVVQYNSLIEYAQINNSTGFLMKNMAEGSLLLSLLELSNQKDRAMLNDLLQGSVVVGETATTLTLAGVAVQTGMLNGTRINQALQKDAAALQQLENNSQNALIKGTLNQTIADINATITAIATNNHPKDAINSALQQLSNVTSAALNITQQVISDKIAARQQLINDAASFHPATLPFNQAVWSVSSIAAIKDGSGNAIGITFNFTLVDAPPKFDFANYNIQLVIKIYDEPVAVQTVDFAQGGQSYSYSLAGGEMKMDFIINNWDWNFQPKVVQLLNSTNLSVSPALALQVDASVFNVSPILAQHFLGNLSAVSTPAAVPKATFSAGSTTANIPYTGQSSDASQLNYTATTMNQNIAGKILKIISAAKLTLDNEATLAGFFKFVPYAIVTNSTGSFVVNVGASYFENGNHLRLYITYPYFNGTLTHDPSIGVQSSGNAKSPAFIITQSPSGSILNIQQIPIVAVYPTFVGAGVAAVVVMLGAIVIAVAVRRRPTVN